MSDNTRINIKAMAFMACTFSVILFFIPDWKTTIVLGPGTKIERFTLGAFSPWYERVVHTGGLPVLTSQVLWGSWLFKVCPVLFMLGVGTLWLSRWRGIGQRDDVIEGGGR